MRNPEPEQLATAIAALTGETKTKAVTRALKERREQLKRQRGRKRPADTLEETARHCASLPMRDTRTDGEILGDGEKGMPS